MEKELRNTHKRDLKIRKSLIKTYSNLMMSVNRLANKVTDLTTQNKTLQRR